jgi:hypothetical protein
MMQCTLPFSMSVTVLRMSVLLRSGDSYSELQKTSAFVPKLIVDCQNYITTGSVLFSFKENACLTFLHIN